jgi:phage regulator Rha-like protein
MEYLNIIKKNIVISTNVIAKELNIEHKNVLTTINSNKDDFESFGKMQEGKEKTKGRPFSVKYLNEEQFIFYITLSKNKKETIFFKKLITKKFFEMRKALLQKTVNQQNKEWLDSRTKGKQTRKLITKEYQNYLKYAIKNGSKTYEKKPKLVYSKFTNMINKALFDFEFNSSKDKTRDFMTREQLNIVNSAELAAQKIIQDEINKETEYHEIYKITKNKMIKYADIVGKTTIVDLITNNQMSLLNNT